MTATLHYLYDPLCGWCYGAEPLVQAARAVPGLDIALHGGGLWPRPTRLPEQTRRYIQQADARIAQMSGQPFGTAYLEGSLLDPALTLDSKPTTAAVLAAQSLDAAKALDMLAAIQHAHYEQGLRVVERDVLLDLAERIGLARDAFETALAAADADAHIAATRALMARLGAAGFPAFALEIDGRWQGVPHQSYASDAQGFAAWLARRVESRPQRHAGA